MSPQYMERLKYYRAVRNHLGVAGIRDLLAEHKALVIWMPIAVEPLAKLERGLIETEPHQDGPYIIDYALTDLLMVEQMRVYIRMEDSNRARGALGMDVEGMRGKLSPDIDATSRPEEPS